MFWLALAAKMAVTAAFVVAATGIAERAGPIIGGLVATLPVSAGPAYVFVSLDHDSAFIADSALAGLVVNAATTSLVLTYMMVARARGLPTSLGAAVATWVAVGLILQAFNWSVTGAVVLNVAGYLVCLPVARELRNAPIPSAVRHWYDVPLRAVMVACLVAAVVAASTRVGPALTGMLATYPIVLTSFILIFQPRIGGPATAALIAHTVPGLVGFAAALTTVVLSARPLGAPAGLALALAASVTWNVLLWAGRRYRLKI